MTDWLASTVLATARATGLFRLLRWARGAKLLALTYHSVVDAQAAASARAPLLYRNALSAAQFEAQMRHLRRTYQVLDGDALRTALATGDIPRRAAVITFDDGLVNNVTVALPILEKLSIPALFFLPTRFLDAASAGSVRLHWSEDVIARLTAHEEQFSWSQVAERLPRLTVGLPAGSNRSTILLIVDHLKSLSRGARRERVEALRNYLPPIDPAQFPADQNGRSILSTMTWSQARTAADGLVTLGSHTVHHDILTRLSAEEADEEIRTSRDRLTEETDSAADFFSYPVGRPGDFSELHQDMLAEAGYRAAFTQIPGFNEPTTDPYALRRIDVSAVSSLPAFCYYESGAKHLVDRRVRPHKYPDD
jgi:peptidoglycan/xylan/chitin deacetylase (PgdA/CDA1 family)